MKAWSLQAVGRLVYGDVPVPDPAPGWTLVRVGAAGICSSDVGRVFTKGTYHFPTIPGHEFAGTVERVSDGTSAGWLGRRVAVFPLIPCGKCPQCAKKRYEMCCDYDYIGSRRDGAFAEYVAVPEWNLVPLPDGVSLRAAALMEPLAVALHAADTLSPAPGMKLAVVGTGMIGFAAARIAQSRGARVTVIGRGEAKAPIAGRLGLDYSGGDAPEGAFDGVLEAVGSPQSVARALSLAAPGGAVTLMGNPTGDMSLRQDDYWKILRRQLTLRGTWNSSYEPGAECDWSRALALLADGLIDPDALITHTVPPEGLLGALEMMRRKDSVFCKVMVGYSSACG